MAVLSGSDRKSAWANFMQQASNEHLPVPITKAELRAAVDAADQWVSDNQASFNSALPLPARSNLTASQKALILSFILQKRYVSGV